MHWCNITSLCCDSDGLLTFNGGSNHQIRTTSHSKHDGFIGHYLNFFKPRLVHLSDRHMPKVLAGQSDHSGA